MSKCFGKGWEFLASELDVDMVTVDRIKEDNRGDARAQIRAVLLDWRSRLRHKATRSALWGIICKTNDLHVNWEDVERILL